MNSSSTEEFVTKRAGLAAAATAPADVQRPKLRIKGIVTRRDADTFTVR